MFFLFYTVLLFYTEGAVHFYNAIIWRIITHQYIAVVQFQKIGDFFTFSMRKEMLLGLIEDMNLLCELGANGN